MRSTAFASLRTLAPFVIALAGAGCTDPPKPMDGGQDTGRDAGFDIGYDIIYPDDPGTPDAGNDAATDGDSATGDGGTCFDPPTRPDGGVPTGKFCDLTLPAVAGAVVPGGLCIRKFAAINNPRMMAFAPNGDLFVATPALQTPGGSGGGPGAIMVFTDDNHDGVSEMQTFLREFTDSGSTVNLSSVHGIVFGCGEIFFTTTDKIYRTPYRTGQRVATPDATQRVAQFDSAGQDRWTHGLAFSGSGTLYASQSVYSGSSCPDTPRFGKVLRVDGSGTMAPLAEGMRNPMYMRCKPGTDVCFFAELGDDGGSGYGAREKLIRVKPQLGVQNYGFPCCATTGVNNPSNGGYNCALCATEERAIPLMDTPFGFAWEPGVWPLPFRNSFVLAKHGSFYSAIRYQGAGVVFASIDPVTHVPNDDFQPIVLGFGDNAASDLRRPADVAFAPDGRLFIADDLGNTIYWVAPTELRP